MVRALVCAMTLYTKRIANEKPARSLETTGQSFSQFVGSFGWIDNVTRVTPQG